MADKVYFVCRVVTSQNGTGLFQFVASYTDEKTAQDAIAEIKRGDAELFSMDVYSDGKPTGMKVGNVLSMWGVAGIGVASVASEPRGAVIVAPASAIILPRTN